jgi:hypothetical protein
VRASAARLAQVRHMAERLRLSVFGQLHKELRAWGPSAFRRAYLGAFRRAVVCRGEEGGL